MLTQECSKCLHLQPEPNEDCVCPFCSGILFPATRAPGGVLDNLFEAIKVRFSELTKERDALSEELNNKRAAPGFMAFQGPNGRVVYFGKLITERDKLIKERDALLKELKSTSRIVWIPITGEDSLPKEPVNVLIAGPSHVSVDTRVMRRVGKESPWAFSRASDVTHYAMFPKNPNCPEGETE